MSVCVHSAGIRCRLCDTKASTKLALASVEHAVRVLLSGEIPSLSTSEQMYWVRVLRTLSPCFTSPTENKWNKFICSGNVPSSTFWPWNLLNENKWNKCIKKKLCNLPLFQNFTFFVLYIEHKNKKLLSKEK